MAQYIDKDALLAEIERRRDAALMRQQNLEAIGQETTLNKMVAFELNRIISFTDTLEVKEVDLDRELTSPIDVTKFYHDGLKHGVEVFACIIRSHLCDISEETLIRFKNEYRKLTGEEMFGGFKD